MSGKNLDEEELTRNMVALDEGLNRIARRYDAAVELSYEDPLTFGAGHFVFYPRDHSHARFVIDEEYTGTDWSDDERVPTSWTWVAERRVRDRNGDYLWAATAEGRTRSQDFPRLLGEVEKWPRCVENRFTHSPGFGTQTRRHEPPAPRL